MSYSVVTNGNALAALQSLTMTQQQLSVTQNRVSTGLKVASASDAPSTFAIAQQMRGDVSGLQAVSDSISMGQSIIGVATSAAQTISATLISLKNQTLAAETQGANTTDIQAQVTTLLNDITTTVSAAQFNGVNLLDATNGSSLTVNTSLNRSGSTVSVGTQQVANQALDLTSLGLSGFSVSGAAPGDASGLLGSIETAIGSVNTAMANLGAFQNLLTDQSNFVSSLGNSMTTGVGNLVDANMAAESAALQAEQTRQSLGVQALSIANQAPSAILALFR